MIYIPQIDKVFKSPYDVQDMPALKKLGHLVRVEKVDYFERIIYLSMKYNSKIHAYKLQYYKFDYMRLPDTDYTKYW